MDTLNYPDIIKQVLTDYANDSLPDDTVTAHLVFDDKRNSYLLLEMGWREKKYIYQPVVHLELTKGKVWIQQDYTEAGIADELTAAGISPEHIVLGFRHPTLRQHTGFAVA